MTDTPIQRAARALVLQESGEDGFDALSEELQAQVIESVKAVLVELRDPSDGMVIAADDLECSVGTVRQWQAMIDAAVAEG